jgi:hypothetical protein
VNRSLTARSRTLSNQTLGGQRAFAVVCLQMSGLSAGYADTADDI